MSHADVVTMPLRHAPRLPPCELCTVCGKHRYATRTAAERLLARKQNEREPGTRGEARAYYVHGWWHLTSSEGAP